MHFEQRHSFASFWSRLNSNINEFLWEGAKGVDFNEVLPMFSRRAEPYSDLDEDVFVLFLSPNFGSKKHPQNVFLSR